MTRRRTPPRVLDWPVIEIVLRDDGSGAIRGRQVHAPQGCDVLPLLLSEACTIARSYGRPLRTRVDARTGRVELIAFPNGQTDFVSATPVQARVLPSGPTGHQTAPRPLRPVPPEAALQPPPVLPSLPDPAVSTPPPHVRTSGSRRPRRVLPAIVGVVAVAVTAGLAAVLLTGSGGGRRDTPRLPASPTTAAILTPTVTAVPPGFVSRPTWAVPIAAWTRSFATDDGTVLTRDPAGHVLLLDPSTGRTRWTSQETTTRDQTGPWPTTIDGVAAAAVISPGRLTYWPLPATTASPPRPAPQTAATTASSPPPTTPLPHTGLSVPLPPDTTVTWTGPVPLVLLPNHTAAVIRTGALLPVPLPTGAVALAANDVAVLGVAGTNWILQSASGAPAAPRALPRPPGAGRAPLRVEAVGTDYLLTIWPRAKGTGQVVALMDVATSTNVVRAEVTAAADLRTFPCVREAGGTQLAIGPLVVDTYAAKIDLLDMTYTVKTLTRGHAWTVHGTQLVDLRLTNTGDFPRYPFAGDDTALPIGAVRLPSGKDSPVVATATETGRMLCALSPASASPRDPALAPSGPASKSGGSPVQP